MLRRLATTNLDRAARPENDDRMDQRTASAVEWLLHSDEPAIRLMCRRDLLDDQPTPADADQVLTGPKVSALLSGQHADGSFGVHFYRKWTGAHWRLVSLAELGIPALEPRALAAADSVLAHFGPARRRVTVINGLARRCASIDGNVLAVCSRLGLASDPRVQDLASSIISWQWPDGGWNCDRSATGYRSSFHESLATAWGLHEYGQATGDKAATEAAGRAAGLFLQHRLFRSARTGEVINRQWLAPRYPPYWHYEVLQALVVLSRMGKVGDERASEGLDEMERARLPDGRWQARGSWWKHGGGSVTPEIVDWGRDGPNEMITLNALRVLRAAGRL
jgi:hypothetical protein